MNALDLLLKANLKDINVPEKEVKLKRLSEVLGNDVIFKIKAIKFDALEDLREANTKDFNIHTVLEGIIEPSLKNKELMEKFNVLTPVDLVKKLLLPGEIEDLYHAISKLSGYGTNTIEDIKKK